MNTQKSVFNKISKIEREVESKEVELSEVQKVELSLITDLKSLLNKARSSEDNLAKMARTIENEARQAMNAYAQVVKEGKDAIQKAKELGANDIVGMLEKMVREAEISEKEMSSAIFFVARFD